MSQRAFRPADGSSLHASRRTVHAQISPLEMQALEMWVIKRKLIEPIGAPTFCAARLAGGVRSVRAIGVRFGLDGHRLVTTGIDGGERNRSPIRASHWCANGGRSCARRGPTQDVMTRASSW
jgi:hypothetical protein